jgi:hypothetical protein
MSSEGQKKKKSQSQSNSRRQSNEDSLENYEKILKNSNLDQIEESEFDKQFRNYVTAENEASVLLDSIFEMILPHFDTHFDINYQNKSNGNTTIIMYLIKEGLLNYAEKLIDQYDKTINLTIKDDKNENIFFKILNSKKEKGKVELFKKALNSLKNNTNNTEKNDAIGMINNSGQSLIEIALKIGNSDITSMLINEGINLDCINKINNENIIHFAVKGKNPYCLKKILDSMNNNNNLITYIQSENKEGETPLQIANKLNLTAMVKLLNDCLKNNRNKNNNNNNENNNNNNNENFFVDVINLLNNLNNENYNEILMNIEKNYYLNEWNKIYFEILKENNNDNNNIEVYKKIIKFFDKNQNEIEYNKENEILFLNYLTSSYKISDFIGMLSIFKKYLKSKENNFIFNVNSILMLIDISLLLQLNNFAKMLLKYLTDYLKKNNNTNEINNINSSILKYFKNNEIITSSENIYDIISLFNSYLNINNLNFDKAQEYLQEFKTKEKSTNLVPLISSLKTFYHILKIRIDFYTNSNFKFYKHLTSLNNFNQNNKDITLILFNYNSLGIFHLKQKNYNFAEYCFKFCEKIIKKNKKKTYNFINTILYNLSLAYFYTKKFDLCYKILNSLKNLDVMSTNPFLYYRLGLCCLEKDLIELKQMSKSENINDLVNQSIFKSEGNEPIKKRFILVNHNPSNLNNNNTYLDSDNINEAIFNFKQCLLIIKGNTLFNKEIYDTFHDYKEFNFIDNNNNNNENKKDNDNNDNKINDENNNNNSSINNNNNKQEFNDTKIFQYKNIFPSVYLNLLFCLLKNENYTEVINYAIEFSKYDTHNNFKYIIDNYLIEAYIKTNECSKALEILSKENFSYNNIDLKGAFFTSGNDLVYNEVSYRLALYINLIKINLLNDNISEAEKYLNSMLSLLNYPSKKDLAPYVLNIILYYLLRTNKNDIAIQILKFRNVPKSFNK